MMKEVLRALETGALAEIGLIAFFLAFVAIVIRALTMSRSKRNAAKNIPLEEEEELPRN